jgi:hypothetical protein
VAAAFARASLDAYRWLPSHAGNTPLKFDSKHDIFLALIAWSELNLPPQPVSAT